MYHVTTCKVDLGKGRHKVVAIRKKGVLWHLFRAPVFL